MANGLKIGTTELDMGCLESLSTATSHSMVGETLSADQLTALVNAEDEPFIPADQEGPLVTQDEHAMFCKFPVDEKILRSHLEAEDKVLFQTDGVTSGVYYLDSVESVGRSKYKLTAVSLIGRLINSRHYGGMYNGALATVILRDVLGTDNFTVTDDITTATVTGYLPIATRRDNLQQVLMAIGATLQVEENGTISILSKSPEVTGTFDSDKCYTGGSVVTGNPVLGVQVTEHNYFKAGNEVTLFEDGVDGEELIEFSQPYHDLVIEGGTIVESGVNFARISAKGTVKLTGQPYTHVTRVVTAGKVSNGTGNVKQVSGCHLANPQIAQTLAERLFEFLSHNKTIKQDVLLGTEQAGDVVNVLNPYTMELEKATIKSIDGAYSSFNKASCEFLVGFAPGGVISGFKNYAQLTGNGNWTVPDGVSKIRIILVAGGSGGGGGSRGDAGEGGTASNDSPERHGGNGGSGGASGKTGIGGKIFEISLDVTAGTVFDFACGTGGVGGEGQTDSRNASDGTEGTATTFGVYSSEYGRLYPYGYFEAKTGQTFGASGKDGFAGGNGGNGADDIHDWDDDSSPWTGDDGEAVNGFRGGRGAVGGYREISERNTYDYGGGGGGGAANGAAGGKGSSQSHGGAGATGVAGEDATNYGQGGGAGNGGGGGGGGSYWWHWFVIHPNDYSEYGTGGGGSPGNGSNGGNGKEGCIIIYF